MPISAPPSNSSSNTSNSPAKSGVEKTARQKVAFVFAATTAALLIAGCVRHLVRRSARQAKEREHWKKAQQGENEHNDE